MDEGDYAGAATDGLVDAVGGKVLSGLGGALLKRARLKDAKGLPLDEKEQAAFDNWMSKQNKHGNDVNSNAPSGYYRLEFESGISYNGVGLVGRMLQSIKNIIEKTGDVLKSKKHTPTKNKKDAYILEDKGIESDGGINSSRNYNEKNSPGRKLRGN